MSIATARLHPASATRVLAVTRVTCANFAEAAR